MSIIQEIGSLVATLKNGLYIARTDEGGITRRADEGDNDAILNEAYAVTYVGIQPGKYVWLTISNTGRV